MIIMKNKILLLLIVLCFVFLSIQNVDAKCINIQSEDTASFMNEIPSINTQLQTCQAKSPLFLYRNSVFLVNINGLTTTNNFSLTIKKGKITEITVSPVIASYTVTMSESDFEGFLRSSDATATVSQLYKAGKITVAPHGFINTLRWWITKPFIGFFAPKQTAKLGVGEICQHGGECETGNCIYESGQGPDRTYKCSCDPFKLDTAGC
jgi:hypothetical protein